MCVCVCVWTRTAIKYVQEDIDYEMFRNRGFWKQVCNINKV